MSSHLVLAVGELTGHRRGRLRRVCRVCGEVANRAVGQHGEEQEEHQRKQRVLASETIHGGSAEKGLPPWCGDGRIHRTGLELIGR